jgi:UDP-N-acetylmuramyl pentapeptide phosphotransferase/UDP-N-acetylglucosamine-1-phosphate transferase
MISDYFFHLVISGLIVFIICGLIIFSSSWHGKFTNDLSVGVQKFHTRPTPRIGGLGILLGILLPIFLQNIFTNEFKYLIAVSLIPFLIGFNEDIRKNTSVKARLIAIVVATYLAIELTQVTLNRVDIAVIDHYLSYWPLAVFITIIAITGFTNSINILDGFNGLSSGVTLIAIGFLCILAKQTHDEELFIFGLIFSGSLIGFMFWNFPFGKIFLGDGGAYFIGFLTGWFALMLPIRNPEISPWVCLLICGYPVVEVLYSIYRRLKNKMAPSDADIFHMHSLIRTRLIESMKLQFPDWFKNSLVAPPIWCSSFLLGFIALNLFNRSILLLALFLCFCVAYHFVYSALNRPPHE